MSISWLRGTWRKKSFKSHRKIRKTQKSAFLGFNEFFHSYDGKIGLQKLDRWLAWPIFQVPIPWLRGTWLKKSLNSHRKIRKSQKSAFLAFNGIFSSFAVRIGLWQFFRVRSWPILPLPRPWLRGTWLKKTLFCCRQGHRGATNRIFALQRIFLILCRQDWLQKPVRWLAWPIFQVPIPWLRGTWLKKSLISHRIIRNSQKSAFPAFNEFFSSYAGKSGIQKLVMELAWPIFQVPIPWLRGTWLKKSLVSHRKIRKSQKSAF